ncbi:MAG: hypothetical protein ISP49_19590 [Reyranella sp.]|nr:hypothetical protein [Reyranella sp.]MBL6653807.1 hypothetical protein [Reyranella sp.]
MQSKLGLPVERDLRFCRQAHASVLPHAARDAKAKMKMRPAEVAERINGENEGASRRTFQPSSALMATECAHRGDATSSGPRHNQAAM